MHKRVHMLFIYHCKALTLSLEIFICASCHGTSPPQPLQGGRGCSVTKWYVYRSLPSKHPPHIFEAPIVRMDIRYTYKWVLHVSTHPVSWPVNFKCPWVLTWENMAVNKADICQKRLCNCRFLCKHLQKYSWKASVSIAVGSLK